MPPEKDEFFALSGGQTNFGGRRTRRPPSRQHPGAALAAPGTTGRNRRLAYFLAFFFAAFFAFFGAAFLAGFLAANLADLRRMVFLITCLLSEFSSPRR